MPIRQPLILIIDNHKGFLDSIARFFRRHGYGVYTAASLGEAREMISTTWVHLLIVDIRMRNDEDELDESGLIWARDEFRQMTKIILTRAKNHEYVRHALRPYPDGQPPKLDYVIKDEGEDVWLRTVRRAFNLFVRVNLGLDIRFGKGTAANHTVRSIDHLLALVDEKVEAAAVEARRMELSDLLSMVFHDKQQITLGRLLATAPTQVWLEVHTFSEAGPDGQFVLLLGHLDAISRDEAGFEQLIAKGSANRLIRYKSEKTLHFAATAYQLLEGELESQLTLADYYHRRPLEVVEVALATLYGRTLAPLHAGDHTFVESNTLRNTFQSWLNAREATVLEGHVNQQAVALCKAISNSGLVEAQLSSFGLVLKWQDGRSHIYPNPIKRLFDNQPVPWRTPYGITHGMIKGENVLVDPAGQTWLINFGSVGHRPLAGDFASLELALRDELPPTQDLATRHRLEEYLLSAEQLGEGNAITGLDSDAGKAAAVINYIRCLAAERLGPDPRSYLTELLFQATLQIAAFDPVPRYTSRQLLPYAHSLLLGAMIAGQLFPHSEQPSGLPPQALQSLWMSDEQNNEAVVEGRIVQLAPGLYRLLRYLYDHKNEVCERQTIDVEVFDAVYPVDISSSEVDELARQRIEQSISRLRQQIERDPRRPQYIKTIRGRGYLLNLAVATNGNSI